MKSTYGYLALGFAMAAQSIFAAEAPDSGEAERCIPISRIEHTKVVDDQTVLFMMKGGKVYKNQLPHRCIGLAQAKAFKYATSQSQLCNVDLITPFGHSTGEVVPGASCALGMFLPSAPEPKQHDN